MTEPLDNVRPGMTGRKEVVVTPDLTVGGPRGGHAACLRHADDDPGDGGPSGEAVAQHCPLAG